MLFSQTALLWFEVLPDLLQAHPGLLLVLPGWLPVLPGLLPVFPGLLPVLPDLLPVLPDLLPVLSGLLPALPGPPIVVVSAPSYSDGWQECLSRVSYSPEIDASKFTLYNLSDTPEGV